MPNPQNDPELFDGLTFGGMKSPGNVKLSGHDSKEEWDIKVSPGTKGAGMTHKARMPKTFTATFYLADDSYLPDGQNDFDVWDDFCALVESTVAGDKPKALEIYHPDLERVGIKRVVKDTIAGLVHDGKGGATGVIKFTEYAPPQPAGGNAASKRKQPDPNQDLKNELTDLTNQYQKTPWG